MKKSKTKICIVPKCGKEVYKEKGILCGYHDREIRDNGKKASVLLVPLALPLVKIVKKNINKDT